MKRQISKTKAKARRTSDIRRSVARWWEDVVKRGSQLNYGAHRRSIDYRGEGPWYSKVSVDALFTDFMISGHCSYDDVRRGEFVAALNRVVKLDKVHRFVIFRDRYGQIVGGRRINFYRFEPHFRYRGFTLQQH